MAVAKMAKIPPELVLNCDQTGLRVILSSTWTMAKQGAQRVDIAGAKEKQMITAVLCGTLVGDFLLVQVIYQGKTERCHPHFDISSDWHHPTCPMVHADGMDSRTLCHRLIQSHPIPRVPWYMRTGWTTGLSVIGCSRLIQSHMYCGTCGWDGQQP